MEHWIFVTILLCGFGLLKELRPSESFVTEYIIEFKNISASSVIHEIYPISTYTTLATVVIVFLVTDFVRYRPVIILQGLSFVATWIFLIWGESPESLTFVQIFYGIAMSADVAYYTYIYGQVSHEHYRKVTSYTYTAALLGKLLAGISGQLLISFKIMNFHQLNYISLFSVSSALCLALFLPKVKQSIYFHRKLYNTISAKSDKHDTSLASSPSGSAPRGKIVDTDNRTGKPDDDDDANLNPRIPDSRYNLCTKFTSRAQRAYPILWNDFKSAYSNPNVIKWSFWWAIATAGNLQVMYYSQALWESIDAYTSTHIYNGAVATIQCLLSSLASIGVGHLSIEYWGESLLCIISILQGISLLWMSQTSTLWIAYFNYIVFRVLFQFVITIASSEVVHGINQDSCGLIFGINTFVALFIQSTLTILVSDKRGFALNERNQFLVYGTYFLCMGAIFFVGAIWVTLASNHFGSKRSVVVVTTGAADKDSDSD